MLNDTTSIVQIQSLTEVVDEMPFLNQEGLENYKKIINFSKLKLHEQISFRNVRIAQNQHVHQIYTKSQSHLPHLVFIHGFGGTPMTFSKMFKDLIGHFQIHSMDVYGFGHSSRGNYRQDFTFEQTVQYYIRPIEQWRKVLKIDRFYLVGHSFGGYIAACYAFANPQRIIHLFLGSPASASDFIYWIPTENDSCLKKMGLCIAKIVYNCYFTPTSLTQSCLSHKKFVHYMTRQYKLQNEEQEEIKYYYCNLHCKKKNSETGFYKLFGFPIKGKINIVDMIKNNPSLFDIDFYYGEKDWMPRQGPDQLVKDKVKGINVTTVPKAGHGVFLQNPSFMVTCLLQRTQKLSVSVLSTQPSYSPTKIVKVKTKKAK